MLTWHRVSGRPRRPIIDTLNDEWSFEGQVWRRLPYSMRSGVTQWIYSRRHTLVALHHDGGVSGFDGTSWRTLRGTAPGVVVSETTHGWVTVSAEGNTLTTTHYDNEFVVNSVVSSSIAPYPARARLAWRGLDSNQDSLVASDGVLYLCPGNLHTQSVPDDVELYPTSPPLVSSDGGATWTVVSPLPRWHQWDDFGTTWDDGAEVYAGYAAGVMLAPLYADRLGLVVMETARYHAFITGMGVPVAQRQTLDAEARQISRITPDGTVEDLAPLYSRTRRSDGTNTFEGRFVAPFSAVHTGARTVTVLTGRPRGSDWFLDYGEWGDSASDQYDLSRPRNLETWPLGRFEAPPTVQPLSGSVASALYDSYPSLTGAPGIGWADRSWSGSYGQISWYPGQSPVVSTTRRILMPNGPLP